MDPESLERVVERALSGRKEFHLDRQLSTVRVIDSVHIEIDGVRYVNFSSNNYLGLTHHPRLVSAISEATRTAGAGAAASPLISGHSTFHASAERALAWWKETQSCVLLPSGYQANQAVIQAIVGAAAEAKTSVRFLIDKLVHASLVDAMRGSGSLMRIFPHNDLKKLRRLLGASEPRQLQVVLTESIFSMDGDAADLRAIVQFKRERPFVLLVDEAHGSGVYGKDGAGLAQELGVSSDVDIFIVTLSKALGCAGGAICASKAFCNAVVNFGRAYIYSTSIAPGLAAGAEAAIQIMRDEPERQRRVRELAARVRAKLGIAPGDSPIVPIIVGEESAALELAGQLKSAGLLVSAVRPPTVPKGSSRLRVTLSCDHTDDEIERLLQALTIKPSAATDR